MLNQVDSEILLAGLASLVQEAIGDGASPETVFTALAALVEGTIRTSEDDDIDAARDMFVRYFLIMGDVK